MKAVTRVGFIGLLVLLMAVPLYACAPAPPPEAPAEAPPTAAPPTVNQPPIISSLTANPPEVTRQATSRVTCSASDPDGDELSYTWLATGGSIRELGSLAIWEAPDIEGEFVISVTVDDAKGGITRQSCTIIVLANQRPVIGSLTAEPSKVTPGGTSIITCLASDPDGDTLSYTWSATGGSISGVGNVVTWKAPGIDGKFVISVIVDDGKGGTVRGECTTTVETPKITVILTPVTDESGTISFAGDFHTPTLVGDNANGKGLRAFFSFDISDLVGGEIEEAKLTFTTKEIVGDPWSISAFLFVEEVQYGCRPLEAKDFHLDSIRQLSKSSTSIPEEVDATLSLSRLLRPPVKPRFQVRLHLASYSNSNKLDDYISLSSATLTVTYTR